MRYFARFGLFLGFLHIVLYFAVPLYASYLDNIAPAIICLPVMFFFGFWWPVLLFFAFAPKRLHQDPETQNYIRKIGSAFHIRIGLIPLRIIALILLWPFSIMNFLVLFKGLKE